MTVTAALLKATQYRLFYQLNHDGAGGDTLVISAATLLTDAGPAPRLQELLNTLVANDAAAALLMLTTPGATNIVNTIGGGVTPQSWSVTWTRDAGTGRAECTVEGTAGTASDAILEIRLVHTYDR